jgi:hypothetical protein
MMRKQNVKGYEIMAHAIAQAINVDLFVEISRGHVILGDKAAYELTYFAPLSLGQIQVSYLKMKPTIKMSNGVKKQGEKFCIDAVRPTR